RSYCAGSQASRVMQDELPIRCPDRLQTPPMRASDAANRPRWSGQAGFFEIWFLVVFEAAARRAWWFRYTTFAPAPGLQPRVAHANSEIACSGWVSVDGVRHELDGAPAVQKHIWGTRRVEELYWLYCPRFDEEVAACLEATAVRLRRRPGVPRLVPIWFRTAHSVLDRCGLVALTGNRVEVRGPARLEFRSTSATRSLRVEAWC